MMDTAKQKVIAQKLLENDISAISYMLEQPQGRYFIMVVCILQNKYNYLQYFKSENA